MLTADDEAAARAAAHKARVRYPAARIEELEQAALLGAWRARQKFDPARGVPWGCYRQLRMAGEILDHVRRAMGRGKVRELPVPDLIVEAPDGAAEVEVDDWLAWLDRAIDGVSTAQRRTVARLRAAGETYPEIGARLGVTSERAYYLRKLAARELLDNHPAELAFLDTV